MVPADTLGAYGRQPAGYRLPGATRLGRVTLQVSDLERTTAYYRDVIGARVAGIEDGVATLTAHGSDDVLLELHERAGAAPVPRRGRLGLFHFAILVPDRPALGRFVAHLAELGLRAGMSDHLVSEAVYLYDPDGLGIEVYVDRPRESWRHSDGQLLMATEPLDVPDLVAAADGVRWDGMPAGTTIGHVHLHVGDLDAARAFYHEGLGLDITVWGYQGALFMSAGGYHHHLGTNIWAGNAESARVDEARLLEWEILLPDGRAVDDVLGSLESAGYSPLREAGSAVAADPWGTVVRLTTG